MQVFRSLEEVPSQLGPTVASVGNFDGVHRAHQEVVRLMADRAHALGGQAVVVTFEPHPYRILRPDVAPRLLTPLPIKLRLLQQTRSEEHTSELQSLRHLVCRLLLEKKKNRNIRSHHASE